MALTLYIDSFRISPYAFSAFVALEEKGVPYVYKTVSPPDQAHRPVDDRARAGDRSRRLLARRVGRHRRLSRRRVPGAEVQARAARGHQGSRPCAHGARLDSLRPLGD